MNRVVIARAPTRIDFGGGWTDVPPYPAMLGGFVCNVAITRYATARVATGIAGDMQDDADGHEASALVAAAIRLAGTTGVRVSLASDFPIGAGMGGSSAAGVVVHGALARWRGLAVAPEALAEQSRATEVEELGIAGGRQDHYAAALGGPLALHFGDRVEARTLAAAPATLESLERRCLLVYTGRSRISGDTITAVIDAFRAGEKQVSHALERMKSLAHEMAASIEDGDVDALGALVAEHWLYQRSLHSAITTPLIDEIVERAARAGAIGCKALGASGGGSVLAIARDDRVDAVRTALADLGELIPFSIARRGFEVLHDGPAVEGMGLTQRPSLTTRTPEGAR